MFTPHEVPKLAKLVVIGLWAYLAIRLFLDAIDYIPEDSDGPKEN